MQRVELMNGPVLTGPVFMADMAQPPAAVVATEIRERTGTRPCPAAPPNATALRRRGLTVAATEVVETPRARFPDMRDPAHGDICYAAPNRQAVLRALTGDAEFVGGAR
jgi:hypothetical protein